MYDMKQLNLYLTCSAWLRLHKIKQQQHCEYHIDLRLILAIKFPKCMLLEHSASMSINTWKFKYLKYFIETSTHSPYKRYDVNSMYVVYFTFVSGGACSHLPTRDKDYCSKQGVTALCHFRKKSKDQTETMKQVTDILFQEQRCD